MKPRILVAGRSNTDMIARVPRIPRPGETILGGEFSHQNRRATFRAQAKQA